jgi:hypothetical protein
MHGVAAQMCRSSSPSIVRRRSRGRSLGSIFLDRVLHICQTRATYRSFRDLLTDRAALILITD